VGGPAARPAAGASARSSTLTKAPETRGETLPGGVADKLRRREAEADFFSWSEASSLHAIQVLVAARAFWHAIERSADFCAHTGVTMVAAHTVVAAIIPKRTCASSESTSVRHTAFLREFRKPCTLLIRCAAGLGEEVAVLVDGIPRLRVRPEADCRDIVGASTWFVRNRTPAACHEQHHREWNRFTQHDLVTATSSVRRTNSIEAGPMMIKVVARAARLALSHKTVLGFGALVVQERADGCKLGK
jgi:hypothetical protein